MTPMPLTLEQINAAGQAEFVAALGGLFEHSPWVARRAWKDRSGTTQDVKRRVSCVRLS